MKLIIEDEVADEILSNRLIELYEDKVEYLITLLTKPENLEGEFSFNIDEEIFYVIDLCKSMESIINYTTGDTNDINLIIEKYNKGIYKAVQDFYEMKKQKESWQTEALRYKEEFEELKNAVGSLIKV